MSAPFQQAPPLGYANLGPRRLHFSSASPFRSKGTVITDSDKTTQLYTVTFRSSWAMLSSKPDMTITRASDNREIGTATFHSFSATELTIYGHPITLDRVSWISRRRSFFSAATGSTLTWRYDSALGDTLTCSNEAKQWLARFEPAGFSMTKIGVLELAGPAVDGALLDELVITALAVVQEEKRRKSATDTADAASNAAAG